MSALLAAVVVFICSFGAALSGMHLHRTLPEAQLGPEVREVVKLVMGLISTIVALVLSLLVSSSLTTYDLQSSGLKTFSANILQLDRTLRRYGPDATAVRAKLFTATRLTHELIWSPNGARPDNLNSKETRQAANDFEARLRALAPTNDQERMALDRAYQQASDAERSRLLMFQHLGRSIPIPVMIILVLWICTLFLGFGLFAPPNWMATAVLSVGGLPVAGAIFLILELGDPYGGLMRISDAPLRSTIEEMKS